MEVLACIAFKQPISQSEIDHLFAADKRGLVVKLRDLRLVEEFAGADGWLRFATTESFLQRFAWQAWQRTPIWGFRLRGGQAYPDIAARIAEFTTTPSPSMIDIELFAGAGGMAVGLKAAGFFPANFYERDEHSCETLRHNLGSKNPTLFGEVSEGKVETLDWEKLSGEVRLLAAGAPCQPFSLAGKHKAERDARNLFPEVMRAVRTLRPRAVFVENVRGLVRTSFRPYYEYILRQLECPTIVPKTSEGWVDHDARIREHQVSVGYQPEYWVEARSFDAADFGVPQHRYRVFIVATRRDLLPFKFPEPTHSREALVRMKTSGVYWDRHEVPKARREVVAESDLFDAPTTFPWKTVRDALTGLPAPAMSEDRAWMNHWSIPGARSYAGHSGSSLDWPSKTIKAGVHGVPGGENTLIDDRGLFRYYTLREAARIQSFPDTHFFTGARIHVTRQIGNAVPCTLATLFGKRLFPIINPPPAKVDPPSRLHANSR